MPLMMAGWSDVEVRVMTMGLTACMKGGRR